MDWRVILTILGLTASSVIMTSAQTITALTGSPDPNTATGVSPTFMTSNSSAPPPVTGLNPNSTVTSPKIDILAPVPGLGNSTNSTISPNLPNSTISPSSPNSTNSTNTTTTNPTTTGLTTTVTTQPAPVVFSLTFSISETFVPDLANPSSELFKSKAANITNEIEPMYRKLKNFVRIIISGFRSGSIIIDSSIIFSSTGTNITQDQVKSTFLTGITNLTFRVDPTSVSVAQVLGNSMPPLITSSLSLIWMSLLLSLALHYLRP